MLGILPILLLMGLMTPTQAQTYNTTLGIRMSNTNSYRQFGVTMQQRWAKRLTFEGIFQTDFRDNHTAHWLIERHQPLIGRRLNWYYGAGPSFGSEESFRRVPETNEKIFTYGNRTIGVDVIAGLELTLLRLNISLDVKPNFNMVGRENWMTVQTGISVRSVLISQKEVEKRKRKEERRARMNEWFN